MRFSVFDGVHESHRMFHYTCSMLPVNEDNLRSEKIEKTGNYIDTQANIDVYTQSVRGEEIKRQQKVFIENTERKKNT